MSAQFKCLIISWTLMAGISISGCAAYPFNRNQNKNDRIANRSLQVLLPQSITEGVAADSSVVTADNAAVHHATQASQRAYSAQYMADSEGNVQRARFDSGNQSALPIAPYQNNWPIVAPPIGLAIQEPEAQQSASELAPAKTDRDVQTPESVQLTAHRHHRRWHGGGSALADGNTGVPAALLGNYIIENGDSLDIKFRGSPELNEQVTVRPDGMISLQIVGDLPAAGLTPEQLRATINASFASELKQPDVTVIVRSFSGNTIYVGGEVYAPGRLNLTGRVTTLNAIILAGGFKDTADQQRVVVRRANGSCCEYDLKSVIECRGGQNVQLQPYDVVYVPKSKIAKVNLFVEQYIDKVLPFSRSFGIFVSHNTGLTSAVGSP